jgi:antitoxin MazE
MRAKLQRIGNSHGVVIPKAVLAHLGIEHSVDIALVGDHLEVRPVPLHPRDGWREVLSALPASAFEFSAEDRAWLDAGDPQNEP